VQEQTGSALGIGLVVHEQPYVPCRGESKHQTRTSMQRLARESSDTA
jgi:hypothetical protein